MSTPLLQARRKDAALESTPGGERSLAHAKRRDIQGLRALAVTAVVINHMTGHPRGGFIGVDVFFVISGFLITGLLLRDIDSGVSLPRYLLGFYKRRVARLLPAALLVIVVTVWVSGALLSQSRAHDTGTDALWAAVFLANWHFASNGTNYFASERAVSPLQHYWSLSVEEQFYLLWPIGLFVVATLATRALRRIDRQTARRIGGITLVAVGSIASFGFALHQTRTTPTIAYFSSFDRAWELGLGALIACVAPRVRLHRIAASSLSLAGLAVILISLLTISGTHSFPAPAAALPCAGAALCLIAGSPRAVRNPLLTNPVSVYVGDISYSVYLVHFPVIILLASTLPAAGTTYRASAIALIVGIATAMYFGVERPVIRLAQRPSRMPGLRAKAAGTTLPGIAAGAAIAALGASLITLAPSATASGDARLVAVDAALRHTSQIAADRPYVGPLAANLDVQLRQSLRAERWPKLTPNIDTELDRQPVPSPLQGCGVVALQSDAACTFGPRTAPHTLYVAGDSTAMAYAQAYLQIIHHIRGWNMRVGAAFGCPFDSVTLSNADSVVTSQCAAHNRAVVKNIDKVRPAVVLITNTYTDRTDASTGHVLSNTQWDSALAGEVGKLQHHPRIALVAPAPLGIDPYGCYTPQSTPIDCVSQVPAQYLQRAANEQDLALRTGWEFVASEGWFCDPVTGYCPAFADGVPIKHDALHVAYAYDDVVYPVVREALLSRALVGP